MTSNCLTVVCRRLRQKSLWLPLCCVGCFLFARDANAGDPQRVKFGFINGFEVGSPHATFDPANSSVGLFLNYNFSEKLYVQFEYENKDFFLSEIFDGESAGLLDNLFNREWSTSVLLNYHFKATSRGFSPFVGVGAGQYYIYDSKRIISNDKETPGDESLDYELREYLRKPGVFGSVGLHFRPVVRTTLFVEGRCSLLFSEDDMVPHPSMRLTDLMAITAGLKVNLN